jgi:hypoxanthine phosphoribosyltransferase
MAGIPSDIRQIKREADCLFTATHVERAIDNLAASISEKLEEKNPIVISMMNGGMVLGGQLITKLGFPLQVSYVHARRDKDNAQSNAIHWLALPGEPVAGRSVLIVDDIYDEGQTMGAVVDRMRADGAAEVYVAVLVDKQHDRKARPDIIPDFIGLQCEDRFLFGYGMHYKGYWRNAPGIYAVKQG